jgi:hypothetical protein
VVEDGTDGGLAITGDGQFGEPPVVGQLGCVVGEWPAGPSGDAQRQG